MKFSFKITCSLIISSSLFRDFLIYVINFQLVQFMNMSLKRGRKKTVDDDDFERVVLQHKSKIVLDNKGIVSKHHGVWEQISCELKERYVASSIYSYVMNNTKCDIRLKLLGENQTSSKIVQQDDSFSSDTSYRPDEKSFLASGPDVLTDSQQREFHFFITAN